MKAEIKKFMGATGNSQTFVGESKEIEILRKRMLKRIELQLEEVKEKKEALEKNDWVEVLDAVFDCDVYQHQDVIDLENAGFVYKETCERGCSNNSLKYTTSFTLAGRWLKELREKTGKDDWYVAVNGYEGEVYFCLKNSWTGKVAKHHDFPKVELGDLVPEEFK